MSITDTIVTGRYGVQESNPFTAEVQAVRDAIDYANPVDLADRALVRITRLRLLTDPGCPVYDVSYCYGALADGTPVLVRLPEYQFPKRGVQRALVAMCKEAGRYGKGLGILDPEVVSILR